MTGHGRSQPTPEVKPVSQRARVSGLLLCLAVLSVLWPATAQARHRGRGGRGSVVFIGGYFYDPFFGPYPWWSSAAFPYEYYPPYYDSTSEARLLVTPKQAAVYVDGYYAGIVDDFDGLFQRLPLSPGAHEITLHLNGYRTVHQTLYLTPRSTFKLRYTMERLGPGEAPEPPPSAQPVPPPPPGSSMPPRTPRPGLMPPPGPPGGPTAPRPPTQAVGYGSLVIRVQPEDADIIVDGERWSGSEGADRLVVQLAAGVHRVEIQKAGFRRFLTEVQIRPGETTPLNVSLSSERPR